MERNINDRVEVWKRAIYFPTNFSHRNCTKKNFSIKNFLDLHGTMLYYFSTLETIKNANLMDLLTHNSNIILRLLMLIQFKGFS